MNWIDVTRPLRQDLAGWPGDTPVLLEQRWSRSRGDSVTVGRFQQEPVEWYPQPPQYPAHRKQSQSQTCKPS